MRVGGAPTLTHPRRGRRRVHSIPSAKPKKIMFVPPSSKVSRPQTCVPFTLLSGLGILTLLAAVSPVRAQTYTWTPTAFGTNYNWNNASSQNNWGTGAGGPFPNAAGDIANVNNNIAGGQTINLQQGITVGQLNLGDSDGSHPFTIASGTGTQTLTFQGATAGAATTLNLSSVGTQGNTISSNVALGGSSPLTINALGGQKLTTSAGSSFATNGNNITLTGGVAQTALWSMQGDLIGNGTVTVNSSGGISVQGAKSFTGTFILNRGVSGTLPNAGSLSVTSGSIANAAEVVINGYLTNNNTQQGGSLHAGNGAGAANNPGQRFTGNKITLNGGSLWDFGQAATVGSANTWQQGQELVQDSVSTLRFNSGFSQAQLSVGTNTLGTRLIVTTLERGAGATANARSSTWGGTARLTFGNIATGNNGGSFLVGAGGAEGTTTMSVIPWMSASTSSASPDGFATYTATGIRALNNSTETTSSFTAGANVSTFSLAVGSDATVNSLRYASPNIDNFGSGRTVTVTSGGVFFGSTGSIGGVGSATAGTLNFGPAEGVVWANGNNANGIGAVITGSNGLTKAGTGSLELSGANTYTGPTNVSGGTLLLSGSIGGDLSPITAVAGTSVVLSGTGTDRIKTGSSFTLAGGTLGFANTVTGGNETLDSLTLSAHSVVDFGTGNSDTLLFTAGISGLGSGSGQFSLAVWNWTADSATQDHFAIGSNSLTPDQLAQISFYSGSGTGFLGTGTAIAFGPNFEIVAVPEPSSTALLGGASLLGLIGCRAFRRRDRRSVQS